MKIMKTNSKILSLLLVTALSITTLSCKTSNAVKGGAIGGTAGGVIGGLLAGKNNTATGIIIGAAIGGSAGALIGNEMDKQAEELQRDLKGAKVERVGEGIKITFESGILFGFDESSLNANSQSNLQDLAKTLNKYPDTNILVEGHTDDKGEESYNLNLSVQRASTVETFLVNQGVASERLDSQGLGESLPVQTNETEAGRAENRRVEVAIYANKKMQKMAKRGELGE